MGLRGLRYGLAGFSIWPCPSCSVATTKNPQPDDREHWPGTTTSEGSIRRLRCSVTNFIGTSPRNFIPTLALSLYRRVTPPLGDGPIFSWLLFVPCYELASSPASLE